MEFDRVINERFSVRDFSDKAVSDEDITKILEVGRVAPTARNLQPQKIYVVKSKEGLKKIDKASPCRYNAPVCLIVASNKSIAWKNDTYSTFEMDASIVATFMMLEATNLNIDNIWVKMFDKDILKSEFNIEDNIEPICLIPLGYRKEGSSPSPMHYNKKELSETVEYR